MIGMKTIILILTLILLTGCSIGENQEKEYTVTMEQVQTEIKYITSVPLLSENKLFICDYFRFNEGSAEGNVVMTDFSEKERKEKPINLTAVDVSYYNGYIYYSDGITVYRFNAETKETETVFQKDRDENVLLYNYRVNIGKGCAVWWEADENLKNSKCYSYDLERNEKTLIAESVYPFEPLASNKIRNGYIGFFEKTKKGYTIYSTDVLTGKKTLLKEDTFDKPKSIVYNGDTLAWISRGIGAEEKIHILSRNKESVLSNGAGSIDIYKNYIIYIRDGYAYVHDFKNEVDVFSSENEFGDFSFNGLRLDEESGTAVLTAYNDKLGGAMYPNENTGTSPSYIFLLKFDEK